MDLREARSGISSKITMSSSVGSPSKVGLALRKGKHEIYFLNCSLNLTMLSGYDKFPML